MADLNKPYHVRPDPQQPHRGGKELVSILSGVQTLFSSSKVNLEEIKTFQAKLHHVANTLNDARLVDKLRMLSSQMDEYQILQDPPTLAKIQTAILQIQVDLKHL